MQNQNTFVNSRDKNEFLKENYDISNTVYNNMNSNIIINFDDETKDIIKNDFSFEKISKLLDRENPKRNKWAFIVLPMIADCFETIKFLSKNNLLIDNDYNLLFMKQIVCFNELNNIELLNYIFDGSETNKKFNMTPIVLQLLKNDEKNAMRLLDWYYEHYKVGFANLLGNLIHSSYKDLIFENLNKYNILDCDNYVLIQSMCIGCDLYTICNYLDQIEDDILSDESLKKIIKCSLRNKDENVFLHLIEHYSYICENFDDIILSITLKRFDTAQILLASYTENIPEDKIINCCCDANDLDIIKFVIENMDTKINIHSKNDILLRTMIANENFDAVEYLLNNLIYDHQALKPKLQRLIRFINDKKITDLIKLKFNL